MKKNSWNAKFCFCDGKLYKSIFSLAIDFELSYFWVYSKLKESNGSPVTISGHTIVLASWLEVHPEYDITGKTPVGGINTGKEVNK